MPLPPALPPSSTACWLGADAIDVTPEMVELAVSGPGLVLLCSDGLWNYTPTEDTLARVIAERRGSDATMIALTESLVSFANDSGGHDNITVALARLPVQEPTDEPGS